MNTKDNSSLVYGRQTGSVGSWVVLVEPEGSKIDGFPFVGASRLGIDRDTLLHRGAEHHPVRQAWQAQTLAELARRHHLQVKVNINTAPISHQMANIEGSDIEEPRGYGLCPTWFLLQTRGYTTNNTDTCAPSESQHHCNVHMMSRYIDDNTWGPWCNHMPYLDLGFITQNWILKTPQLHTKQCLACTSCHSQIVWVCSPFRAYT